jgi:hypothetical protein
MEKHLSKRRIAMAIAFMMLIASLRLPLAARERRGAMVEVTMADGSVAKGELLAVKSDALLVYNQDARNGERIDLRQATKVKIYRKSKLLSGMAVGLGIGLVVGANPEQNVHIDHYWSQTMIASGIIGGILGAFPAFFPEILSLDIPRTRQENLEQLKRHARERGALQ